MRAGIAEIGGETGKREREGERENCGRVGKIN